MLTVTGVSAQTVSVKWELSDKDNLSATTMTGEEAYTSLLTASFIKGAYISSVATMNGSNADAGYTAITYNPVYVPQGVTVWSVTNRSTEGADTLKLTKIASGKILPKDRSIIFNATTATPKFVPTSFASITSVSNTYVKGFYCDSLVTDPAENRFTYEFRDGDRGVGFYRTYGEKVIKGGTAFAQFTSTEAVPAAESYVIGLFQKATGIQQVGTEEGTDQEAVYSLQGVRLSKEPVRGMYIKGGKKFVK